MLNKTQLSTININLVATPSHHRMRQNTDNSTSDMLKKLKRIKLKSNLNLKECNY